jgi:hypothetical protein
MMGESPGLQIDTPDGRAGGKSNQFFSGCNPCTKILFRSDAQRFCRPLCKLAGKFKVTFAF